MNKPMVLAAAMLVGVAMPCRAQDVNGLMQRPALRFELGSRTQLLVQPPQRLADGPASPFRLEQPRASEAGVGIELKLRPASRSRDLKQLLRLQLSQRSALQFRPRSGGLAVTYREEF